MQLRIKKIYEDAILPQRAYKYDSGFDLFAHWLDEERAIIIKQQERKLIGTGIAIKLPDPDITNERIIVYEGQLRPKSGLALKQGLANVNTPGTIDNSYIDEIKVIVINLGTEPTIIHKYQKIAQLVICPVVIPTHVIEVDNLEKTDRNTNGFGSTGIFA